MAHHSKTSLSKQTLQPFIPRVLTYVPQNLLRVHVPQCKISTQHHNYHSRYRHSSYLLFGYLDPSVMAWPFWELGALVDILLLSHVSRATFETQGSRTLLIMHMEILRVCSTTYLLQDPCALGVSRNIDSSSCALTL